MCDVRSEILKLYQDYLAYLEAQIDVAINSNEYAVWQEYIDTALSNLLPKESHHSFGPFHWTSIKHPQNLEAQELMENLCRAEKRQREILDKYSPEPSFESFIDWLAEPKLNEDLVEKLRSKRDR
jgi:hypothetical protein